MIDTATRSRYFKKKSYGRWINFVDSFILCVIVSFLVSIHAAKKKTSRASGFGGAAKTILLEDMEFGEESVRVLDIFPDILIDYPALVAVLAYPTSNNMLQNLRKKILGLENSAIKKLPRLA